MPTGFIWFSDAVRAQPRTPRAGGRGRLLLSEVRQPQLHILRNLFHQYLTRIFSQTVHRSQRSGSRLRDLRRTMLSVLRPRRKFKNMFKCLKGVTKLKLAALFISIVSICYHVIGLFSSCKPKFYSPARASSIVSSLLCGHVTPETSDYLWFPGNRGQKPLTPRIIMSLTVRC